jgi:hypothetical protein
VQFTPITEYLASPAFCNHPLCVAYTKARQDLIDWGAQEPEQTQSLIDDILSQGISQQQQEPKNKCPVLPAVADVLVYSSSQQLVFPEQKALTRLAQKVQLCWSTKGLTEEGKKRVQHLSRPCSTDDDTGKYLQSIAKFPEELQLQHSPLAFISHTESLSEQFPKDLFSVVFCFLLAYVHHSACRAPTLLCVRVAACT